MAQGVAQGVAQGHMHRCGFVALFGIVLMIGSVVSALADPYLREELHLAMPAAGAGGLEALLVRPNEPGRYPLALINHGSPRSADERPDMTPWSMLPEAIEFARRGFACGGGDAARLWRLGRRLGGRLRRLR